MDDDCFANVGEESIQEDVRCMSPLEAVSGVFQPADECFDEFRQVSDEGNPSVRIR